MIPEPIVPLVIPWASGPKALDDLPRVPWDTLKHRYGCGAFEATWRDPTTKQPRTLQLSVDGCLRDLVSDDAEVRELALQHGLFGTIYHQGALYEATAYAVPFLVTLAAGRAVPTRAMILVGVADILRGALRDPSRDECAKVLAAFEASRVWLRAAGAGASPALAGLVALLERAIKRRPVMTDAIDAEFEDAMNAAGDEAYPNHNKA